MVLEQSRIGATEDKLQYQLGDMLERHMRLWAVNKAVLRAALPWALFVCLEPVAGDATSVSAEQASTERVSSHAAADYCQRRNGHAVRHHC